MLLGSESQGLQQSYLNRAMKCGVMNGGANPAQSFTGQAGHTPVDAAACSAAFSVPRDSFSQALGSIDFPQGALP